MLSQSTGYAISALGVIATAKGKPMLIKDIARIGEIPNAYLGKIMNSLSKKGIVKSQRGIGGGVVLIPAPEDLTVYDICEILDEPAIQERCVISSSICSNSRACPMHYFWQEHREKHIEFFKKTTIAHIASFEISQESVSKLKALSKKKIQKSSKT